MLFFCLAMLDALALGLLLTMSELLSLVFATIGFTVRIQWYHHFHTLIMGYAFILFICFVTYEGRLMRPPCHCLNRSRLKSRSVLNEVSSSYPTRHQYTRLCSQNSWSCPIYRTDSHQYTWRCHRNFDYNCCTILCGDNCTHRNCTNHCCPDLFPPPTSYIDSPASYISFISLASLTSTHLSASLEYYFTPLYTPASSPPPYICLFQLPPLVQSTKSPSWRTCGWRVPLQHYVISQVQVHCHSLERIQWTRICQNMCKSACLTKTMP